MSKGFITPAVILTLSALAIGGSFLAWHNNQQQLGAPTSQSTRHLLPFTDSTYDVGSTTLAYRTGYFDELCLTADTCETTWPEGGAGGGGLATTTPWTAGNLAYVIDNDTLASVATGTLSESVTGLEFDATRSLVGGAAALSLTTGYVIPLSASTTNWNTFYDTPSNRITGGTGLTWTGNTLDVDDSYVLNTGDTISGDLTVTGTTTVATTTASRLSVSELTSALVQTGSDGLLAEYAGTSCTNQVFTALSALGVATCSSINNAYWSGTDLSVSNGGTGASTFTNNRVLTGNGTSALVAEANLTFDGSILTVAGELSVSATSTLATTTSSRLTVSELTSALTLTDANGLLAEYTGTSCTNQFVRSLSALGVATCASVATADITDGTIIEPDLDADDTPSDGDVLTYDATGTNFVWITCAELTGSADLCDGSDAGGGGSSPGGSATHVQFNNGGTFGGESAFTFASTTDQLALTSSDASDAFTINYSGDESALVINQTSTSSTDRVVKIINSQASGVSLFIEKSDTNNSQGDIRIDSPAPEIEFVETDQASPAGKWEIRGQGGAFQWNSRNAADSSFENMMTLRAGISGAALGVWDAAPAANFSAAATSTQDLLHLSSLAASDGDLVTIAYNGIYSANWADPTTGLGRILVNSNATSPTSIDATNTIAVGTGTGGANATNKYLGQFGWYSRDSSFTAPKLVAYISAEATETYAADADVGSSITFWTGSDNGTNPSQKAILTNAGNFAVGSSTAAARLTAQGASGGSILSLFSDAGTKFMEMLNTGVTTLLGSWDFGGATFLEIPNGTGNTADDPGEIAHDTSDNQLILDDRVIRTREEIFKVKFASSTPMMASSTTTYLPVLFDGYTVTDIACFVEGGTSKRIILFGETITCTTAITEDDGTIGSGTVAALATTTLQAGTDSGSWNWLNLTVYGSYTRE
jgi:hypothetical protein